MAGDRSDPEPHRSTIRMSVVGDTGNTLLAAPGLFENYTVKKDSTSITFSDEPYPLGLNNSIILALKEVAQEFDEPVHTILSIGCGRVAERDIPDLLQLGYYPLPAQALRMRLSPFSMRIYSWITRLPKSGPGNLS